VSTEAIAAVAHRTAEAVSRRNSLLMLGGATLAAGLVRPPTTEARKSAAKTARKKCKRQVGQCIAHLDELCEGLGCTAEDLAKIRRCCAPFGSCNASGFLECFISGILG
jgi:hypothetical protein